ncbi:TetR/AcrR family transcriptional regulator [Mesobacillus maritimus]|uniref:TetR/AcrR family transcriptional regulator n=1 Tax=Mesobacillus maritimus TaxID=1643336 RepID=A0ABS7KC40_9BACI|nr:TetR/AcrR family transcriptional regulator [Mesobacillus maritimus]MBY0099665.1 TetR/AcrR family transcriptional regulator [Mesobacillus maritimus]
MNKKQKQIIDVAHKLFLEKGFGQTSIQDILDEAKIAKGTFYKYFKSKNECLIAILELVKQESDQKRNELLIGNRIDDEEVFADQISIRLATDKEYNILALFLTTSFMTDRELGTFMVNMHMSEVHWVSRRLIDIYGGEIKEIALDQAVIFLGILQHTLQVGKMASLDFPDKKAVQFALRQLKPIIREQYQKKDVLFPIHLIPFDEEDELETVQQLTEQVVNLLKKLLQQERTMEETELFEFLIAELKMEKPRILIIESIWRTLGQAAKQTKATDEYNELLQKLSYFITLTKKVKD